MRKLYNWSKKICYYRFESISTSNTTFKYLPYMSCWQIKWFFIILIFYFIGKEDESQSGRTRKRKRMLSNEERRMIHLNLLKRSVNGRLRKGPRREVSQKFSVLIRTITSRPKILPCRVRLMLVIGRRKIVNVKESKSISTNFEMSLYLEEQVYGHQHVLWMWVNHH